MLKCMFKTLRKKGYNKSSILLINWALLELLNSLFKIITNSQLAKENINWVNLNNQINILVCIK